MKKHKVTRVRGSVMDVNSYLVESDDSVVIVDGMLTVSDAAAVREKLKSLHKPLRGLVVTHAHPDHYAGAATILQEHPDTPILATAAVRSIIERDDPTKDSIVGPMMGPEWPAERRFPDRVVEGEVELGDLRFEVRDVGVGESPADSLWLLDERTVFVGDLVYNGMHAYLADGHYSQWLSCLDRLQSELHPDAQLYVGHGQVVGKDAIEAQRRYIQTFVESVHAHLDLPSEIRTQRVSEYMKRFLPTDSLAFLMELSVEPVAEALSPSS